MNTQMWQHPATRANVEMLQSHGSRLIGPAAGRLACGAEGPGRMAPVKEILETIRKTIQKTKSGRNTK
jgi:phosphopantothenoylcysteine decarboxylase/phosphopantothenate--cysteine ligase